jgi:hypothetical protein
MGLGQTSTPEEELQMDSPQVLVAREQGRLAKLRALVEQLPDEGPGETGISGCQNGFLLVSFVVVPSVSAIVHLRLELWRNQSGREDAVVVKNRI